MDGLNFKKLKKAIFNAETAGGQLMRHPVIKSGIHAGERAVGKYAMMPNTAEELARLYPQEFPGMQNLTSDILEQKIKQDAMIPEALRPKEQPLEERLTDKLLERVVERQEGAVPRIAAAWNAGHNLSPEGADAKLKKKPGVKKYAKDVTQLYNTPEALLPNKLATEVENPEEQKFNLIRSLLNIPK